MTERLALSLPDLALVPGQRAGKEGREEGGRVGEDTQERGLGSE